MNEPDSTHVSPDGRVRIEYESSETRMSLWVNVPRIVEIETGRVLFESRSSLWSGEHEWGEGGRFTLYIAHYPDGGNTVTLHFDIDENTVMIEDGAPRPLREAARLAEKEFAGRRRNDLFKLNPATSAASAHKGRQPASYIWKVAMGAIVILAAALFAGSYWA